MCLINVPNNMLGFAWSAEDTSFSHLILLKSCVSVGPMYKMSKISRQTSDCETSFKIVFGN